MTPINGYRFQIPVGDWSGDGHGRCDWYTAISNKPVEEVREVVFQMDTLIPGFSGFFAEYEAAHITDAQLDSIVSVIPEAVSLFERDDVDWNMLREHSEGYARLLVMVLKASDPDLEIDLEIERMPSLVFNGRDDQGRHLSYGGYGLFS
jgi:uncharacterized protein YodC (DUF2158 family)